MSAWESLRARYAESADPLRTQRRIELVAVLLGLFICLQVVFGLFGVAVFSGPGAIDQRPPRGNDAAPLSLRKNPPSSL